METLVLALALVLLLALNAFFVLAEFAIVKVRPSRVSRLASTGEPRAVLLASITEDLDAYLSVCQVGITLASVALGMVGEQTAEVLMGAEGGSTARYVVAIAASFLLISGSHILLGELVPKSIAIRVAERAALACALPLRVFRRLFFPAIWLLTLLANGILRLIGLRGHDQGEHHTEGELRLLLDQSQSRGLMSFRRLLYMENVFDLGDLLVRDVMRQRSSVRTLDSRLPWDENLATIREARFTRYPLLTNESGRPAGFVHLKDLVIRDDGGSPDLEGLARPLLATSETTELEQLLADMQRRRLHAALVTDEQDRWTGFVTLEDVIEELVGTIRDEFEDEEPVRVGDALTPERIHFGIEADSPFAAIRAALAHMRPESLPLPAPQILRAIGSREPFLGTCLAEGVGLRHARVPGLAKPFLLLLYSPGGVRLQGPGERAYLLFLLLTPAGQPRIHRRIQSILATLLHESDYVHERLLAATTAEEVLDVIRTGEQAAID